MNTPLTPLQLLVAKHYREGEFEHVETLEDVKQVGDTLFEFTILEAGDMSGPYDLCAALHRAVDELRHVAEQLA